jgi:peroxiredoxin
VALAPDKSDKLKEVALEDMYEFPIIPDIKGKIAKSYKVYDYRSIFILGTKMAIPSTFILDKNGKIVYKFVGTKYIRASFEMIISAIDKNL